MLLPYGGKKMRILMDHLKDKIQNEILVLFAWDSDMNKHDPKTTIAVNVNKNLTKQYDARKILKRVSTFLGTKEGGGREEFAMTSINKMIKEDELDRVFEDLIQSLS
jgi:alanyl-tRNA synthetase